MEDEQYREPMPYPDGDVDDYEWVPGYVEDMCRICRARPQTRCGSIERVITIIRYGW